MALTSHITPQSASPETTNTDDSPSTDISSSANASFSMARAPSSEPPVAESSRGVSYRTAVDLPRSVVASKGGCWTCRLRRKKCDEQRQDDSCQTCIRLKIKCLGWGSKRPEWMRDKQAVEAYKAEIKSQLTRAGLIRGQPRMPSLPSPPPPVVPSHTRSQPQYYNPASSAAGPGPSTLARLEAESSTINYSSSYLDALQSQLNGRNTASSTSNNSIMPMIPSGPSSGPQQIPVTNYRDTRLNTLNTPQLYPSYISTQPSSQRTPPATTPLSTTSEHVNFDFPQVPATQQQPATGCASSSPSSSATGTVGGQSSGPGAGHFQFELGTSSPAQGLVSAQTSMQANHVLYYFEHVRKLQYIFAGNSVTNVTYSMIVQEPQGAVTNAVCALARLHYQRMRVARGLEAPEANPGQSLSRWFHDEAYYQLANAKQLQGRYNESHAIAALHLVSFSLLSGGLTDWRPVLTVALDWLGQTGLVAEENPRLAMLNMNFASQCAIKMVLWLDIFSSLTLMHPPRFLGLYRRLLAGDPGNGAGGYWAGSELTDNVGYDLRMEFLSGCPDDVMLAIAEVSALAHWKETEYCNGSLSVREMVRRGDEIERQLLHRQQHQEHQRQHAELVGFSETNRTPLHPGLPQALPPLESSGHTVLPFVDDEIRRQAGSIFREAVMLYLHTVLNDSYPGVSEIGESVGKVIQLLNQLPPSEIDRSLVFPICLAGCMTDDPARRDVLKARLQAQEQNIGNLRQILAVLESVWQKRDAHGGAVDWRETMRDHNLNLLLV